MNQAVWKNVHINGHTARRSYESPDVHINMTTIPISVAQRRLPAFLLSFRLVSTGVADATASAVNKFCKFFRLK